MNVLSRTGTQIVSIDEAKANSRVTSDIEDALFSIWLDVAHEKVEESTNLLLQLSTCEQTFEGDYIELNAPVRGIVSVTKYDNDNVATVATLNTDYRYTKSHKFGVRITLTSKASNYTVVKYVAGFGSYTVGSDVGINTDDIQAYSIAKQSILLLTNHYYENRGVVSDFKKHVIPKNLQDHIDSIRKYL